MQANSFSGKSPSAFGRAKRGTFSKAANRAPSYRPAVYSSPSAREGCRRLSPTVGIEAGCHRRYPVIHVIPTEWGVPMAASKDKIISYPPGTVIFRQGDFPNYGYVVLSGEVEISTRGKDGRVVLTRVIPHQLFGELALLEDTPRSATATTIKGCEVMAINKVQFFKKLERLDAFSRYWILYLSDRVKDLSKRARNY
jgi:hypothetical protein